MQTVLKPKVVIALKFKSVRKPTVFLNRSIHTLIRPISALSNCVSFTPLKPVEKEYGYEQDYSPRRSPLALKQFFHTVLRDLKNFISLKSMPESAKRRRTKLETHQSNSQIMTAKVRVKIDPTSHRIINNLPHLKEISK